MFQIIRIPTILSIVPPVFVVDAGAVDWHVCSFCTIILLYVLCPRCGMGCWYCRSSVSSFRFFFHSSPVCHVVDDMDWYTVDSRYLEFWNTSRYPYLDISDLQNWEKKNPTTTFNKYICNWRFEVRDVLKILWKRGEIAPKEQFLLFFTIFFTCC